jgi:hypothetical protein
LDIPSLPNVRTRQLLFEAVESRLTLASLDMMLPVSLARLVESLLTIHNGKIVGKVGVENKIMKYQR